MTPTEYDLKLERARSSARAGVRGRYAPSPTGLLHLGNLRTALLAWLQVRLTGGTLILRMEDLDLPRVKPESESSILADLRWLGLDWDEGPDAAGEFGPYHQSKRSDAYAEALRRLDAAGLIYPCYCSRKDVAQAASAPHREGAPPIYPGTCRKRTGVSLDDAKPVKGRPPSWRYRIAGKTIAFEDQIKGAIKQDLEREVGDFVLKRSDGLFAYQLAVVVDDALMGVTDVLRGEDLLDSTPRQIELFQALGFPVPRFWHVPMMMDAKGRRLAKRHEADSLTQLRKKGWSEDQVIGYLASSLGLVAQGVRLTAADLLKEISLERFHASLRSEKLRPGPST